jgi:hypothetical protein
MSTWWGSNSGRGIRQDGRAASNERVARLGGVLERLRVAISGDMPSTHAGGFLPTLADSN